MHQFCISTEPSVNVYLQKIRLMKLLKIVVRQFRLDILVFTKSVQFSMAVHGKIIQRLKNLQFLSFEKWKNSVKTGRMNSAITSVFIQLRAKA